MAQTLSASFPANYAELWPVFQKQLALYSYGNTSVRDETAQALIDGVKFTMELGGTTSDAHARFAAGRKAIDRLLRTSRTLLAGVQKTALETENISYNQTLAALPSFFTAYDKNFFPQEIPCDIDYQTAIPMLASNTQGVVWLHEYLRRLLWENQFCSLFPTTALTELWQGAFPALQDDLVNLFTPALLCALAARLLGKDIHSLYMDDADRQQLLYRFEGLPPAQLEDLLLLECASLCAIHFSGNTFLYSYIKDCIIHLAPGIAAATKAQNLATVFPSAVTPPFVAQATGYEEGPLLPAEALRALIEEMQGCRYTSDKLAILQREIHNLRDYTDLLENCFANEEYPAAFALLAPPEIQVLCERLAAEHSDNPPHWGKMLLAWLESKQ